MYVSMFICVCVYLTHTCLCPRYSAVTSKRYLRTCDKLVYYEAQKIMRTKPPTAKCHVCIAHETPNHTCVPTCSGAITLGSPCTSTSNPTLQVYT